MQLQVLQALNKWERREFTYGNADCCQFAGFIVKELTGKDYLVDFNYNSEEEAYDIIRSNGDLEDTVSTVLGESTSDIKGLEDGSPVMVTIPDNHLLGIKLGDYAICLTHKGLARLPSEYISLGWKLCHQ
jgi:hypothetical protein